MSHMTSDPQVVFLKRYAMATTTIILGLTVAGFAGARQKQRFEEIDVERINVVEKDGKLRLVIANHARLPDPVIGGKSYPLRGGNASGAAGMIFFNDEGNENGGMTWAGRRSGDGFRASAGLSFDQYDQDETVTLSYADENRRRRAGLSIMDRSDEPIQIFAESLMALNRLPDGPDKTQRIQRFRQQAAERGVAGAQRLYAGKVADRAAVVVLSDPRGRPRLRLRVDSLGAPRIEFLDASGKVTRALTDSTAAGAR